METSSVSQTEISFSFSHVSMRHRCDTATYIQLLICALACVTFAPVSERNNTSNAYRLRINDLPWNSTTRYYIDVQRVGGTNATTLEFTFEGQGSSIGIWNS